MIGRAVSHYRVLSALGSGGMGIVYLAEDERLGRQVALKFLPPDSVKNRQALDRFRVEARAASSLSHPGICAIYDIGEDEGTPFIVMEVLRGENLRDRINRGPLKIGDVVEIGIQLADALEAAHTQGIIHRDIKPSNIFVGDKNRTKILDFGLAKLSTGTTTTPDGKTVDASTHQTIVKQITIPGSALGTVSYMSPEQARGEDVDTRTDLFSLGAVLYEMATGTQSFGGTTPAVVFNSILNHTPPPMLGLNPLVPPRLESIIATLLEKDRDLRCQHASDLQAELKRLKRDLDSGTMMGVGASRSNITVATEAARPPSSSQLTPATQPARVWPYAIGVVALLIAGAVGYTVWSGRQQPAPAPVAERAAQQPVTPPPSPSAPADQTAAPISPPPAAPETAAPAAPPRSANAPAHTEPTPTPRSTTPPRTTAEPTPTTPPARSTAVPTTIPVAPPAAPALPSPAPQATAPPPAPQTGPQTSAPPATQVPVQPPATVAIEPPPVAPPPQPKPTAPARGETVPAPAVPRATAPPDTPPPTSPVEADDVLIRRVINTYKTAIETKSVGLYRSVRPGLSSAEETRLRDSFRQVDSQQIMITVEDLRVEGRTATARISRQDVIINGGRRQTQSSRQTMRFEKSATGWIITAIGS